MTGALAYSNVLQAILEHVELTLIAVTLAVSIGVPLGVYLARHRFLSGPVLALIGVIQTIPSLALLGLLIPFLGIGEKPAIVALFAYALLPIVAGTFTALDSIDKSVLEAARGMGMQPWQILLRVALPLGLPVVMRGIRVSTVINVGVATLAALIGGGGLGTFIFRGIAMVDTRTVLAGAVPAAVLALAFDGALALVERSVVPRGLRAR